jgi:hypothetical protein
VSTGRYFSVKRTEGKWCSAENSIANAMMPEQHANAGRESSILPDNMGIGSLGMKIRSPELTITSASDRIAS